MLKAIKILPLIAFAIFLASCSSSVRFNSADSEKDYVKKSSNVSYLPQQSIEIEYPSDDHAKEILEDAESWLGVSYQYGGESRSGADCSGFVWSVFKSLGYTLPRTAHQQWQFAVPVNTSDARPSDLVFFSDDPTIDHVGIYLGNDRFIHSSTSRGVIISSLSESYYSRRFRGFGRISGIY
jgi:lipoprotein Spr